MSIRVASLLRLLPCAVLWMSVLMPGGETWAHARLLRSDPAARATVTRIPESVRLWFNERIEPAYSSAELRDARDRLIATGKATVSPQDPKLLLLPLPALDNGVYVVVFRVLSVDGHVVTSRLRFELRIAKP